MSHNEYRRFLESYSIDDYVAFLLIDRRGNQAPRQRRVPIRYARNLSFYDGLCHANRNGADIYVSMNPLQPGATGRTKRDIGSVRHLYLDFDVEGDARLDKLLAHPHVPTPHLVLHTSRGKWQVIWNVTSIAPELAEGIHRSLITTFGADPAAIDISRVLRVPSFYNNKYSPPFPVSLVRHDGPILGPADFKYFPPQADTVKPLRLENRKPGKTSGGCSQSERDWAWTLEKLKAGASPRAIAEELATRRKDKPSPLYYARHTVARAELELRARSPIAYSTRNDSNVRQSS
jgi:hypothetical protein